MRLTILLVLLLAVFCTPPQDNGQTSGNVIVSPNNPKEQTDVPDSTIPVIIREFTDERYYGSVNYQIPASITKDKEKLVTVETNLGILLAWTSTIPQISCLEWKVQGESDRRVCEPGMETNHAFLMPGNSKKTISYYVYYGSRAIINTAVMVTHRGNAFYNTQLDSVDVQYTR